MSYYAYKEECIVFSANAFDYINVLDKAASEIRTRTFRRVGWNYKITREWEAKDEDDR